MDELEKKTGFAALTKEQRTQIAAMGGRAVPRKRRHFYRKRKCAQDAGRKGGLSVSAEKRSFKRDPEAARAAGRKGGLKTAANKRSFYRDRSLACQAGERGRTTQRTRRAQESAQPVAESTRLGSTPEP